MGPAHKFDSKVTYSEKPEVYCNDGREIKLLQYIFGLPDGKLNKLRGNPHAVLDVIDDFGKENYLMNIGEAKGRIVTARITDLAPAVSLELGGYIGYSTILFGATARAANPSARYYCLEYDPVYASVIMALVDLAGLKDTISVLIGPAERSIRYLKEKNLIDTIDFALLDHMKSLYTRDLKVMEEMGMIKKGTTLVADNMVDPGNPMYHRYLHLVYEEKRREVQAAVAKGPTEEGCVVEGDPRIVYRNEWIESYEPTGQEDAIEISTCVDFMGRTV